MWKYVSLYVWVHSGNSGFIIYQCQYLHRHQSLTDANLPMTTAKLRRPNLAKRIFHVACGWVQLAPNIPTASKFAFEVSACLLPPSEGWEQTWLARARNLISPAQLIHCLQPDNHMESLASTTPSGSNPSGVRNAFQCPSRKTMTKDIAPNTKRAKMIIKRERI